MQSNTAEIGNRPVNFSSFSVEKKRCECDPFTVRDGHYVGHDGFVVPKDFAEFYKRFPGYVHRWAIKHAGTSASQEDKEDWTQDLLIHLSRLPQISKYREAGKVDIVATFDPLRQHGANEARFRNYVNLCLANKFRTMHSKRMPFICPLSWPPRGAYAPPTGCQDGGRPESSKGGLEHQLGASLFFPVSYHRQSATTAT